MGTGWIGRLAGVLVVAANALAGAAEPAAAPERGHGGSFETRQLTGTLVGKQFVAGPFVYVDAQLDDDLFAAGGEVTVQGLQAVDLFAVGGLLDATGLAATDAVLAGGSIAVGGALAGDLLAAGGQIEIRRSTEVQGDALLAGGRIEVAGAVRGGLRAAGGRIRIDGTVDGPVSLVAGHVTLGPNAVIRGELSYRSGDAIEILEGAQVAGEVVRAGPAHPDFEGPSAIGFIFAALFGWVGAVVALVLLAAVLLAVLPRLLTAASRSAYLRPGAALALGIGVGIALPVAAGIAVATLVGAPVGLAGLALYAVLLAAGAVTAALWVGGRLPRLGDDLDAHLSYGRRLVRAAAGIVVLALVALIPFLGGVAVALAIALGLGGIAREGWRLLGGDGQER